MNERLKEPFILSRRCLVGAGAVCLAVILVIFFLPLEVRHSAPFGVVRSLDSDRGVAVTGARFRATYGHLDRVDLDLRAYTSIEAGDEIDLIVHIRGDSEGAKALRSVPISVSGWQIANDKPAFENVFTTVRFEPIEDSAGREYYVWVERGPANVDDIVTVWSLKSYSTVTAATVLTSFVEQVPWGVAEAVRWIIFAALGIVGIGAFSVLVMVFVQSAIRSLLGRSLNG